MYNIYNIIECLYKQVTSNIPPCKVMKSKSFIIPGRKSTLKDVNSLPFWHHDQPSKN